MRTLQDTYHTPDDILNHSILYSIIQMKRTLSTLTLAVLSNVLMGQNSLYFGNTSGNLFGTVVPVTEVQLLMLNNNQYSWASTDNLFISEFGEPTSFTNSGNKITKLNDSTLFIGNELIKVENSELVPLGESIPIEYQSLIVLTDNRLLAIKNNGNESKTFTLYEVSSSLNILDSYTLEPLNSFSSYTTLDSSNICFCKWGFESGDCFLLQVSESNTLSSTSRFPFAIDNGNLTLKMNRISSDNFILLSGRDLVLGNVNNGTIIFSNDVYSSNYGFHFSMTDLNDSTLLVAHVSDGGIDGYIDQLVIGQNVVSLKQQIRFSGIVDGTDPRIKLSKIDSSRFLLTYGEGTGVHRSRVVVQLGGLYLNSIDFLVPASPTSLAIKYTTDSSITISWHDNSDNESEFIIERSTGNDSQFEALASVSKNILEYTDQGLEIGNAYFYRVIARNQFGSSDYSDTLTFEINITGIAEDISFIVYPIPSSGKISIENLPESWNLQVLDIAGKRIKHSELLKTENRRIIHIETSNSKVVFLELRRGNHRIVNKLILSN